METTQPTKAMGLTYRKQVKWFLEKNHELRENDVDLYMAIIQTKKQIPDFVLAWIREVLKDIDYAGIKRDRQWLQAEDATLRGPNYKEKKKLGKRVAKIMSRSFRDRVKVFIANKPLVVDNTSQ